MARKSTMNFAREAHRRKKTITEFARPVPTNTLKNNISEGAGIVERKHDGVRARISNGRVYSRSGRDVTSKFPEFKHLESLEIPLDGEIVADSGKLQDIQGRMHMQDEFKIRLTAKKYPATFYAFDVPVDTLDLRERKEVLHEEVERKFPLLWLREVEQYEFPNDCDPHEYFTDKIEENGWEGVVVKKVWETYNEATWFKYKPKQEDVITFDTYEDTKTGIVLEQQETGYRVAINGHQAKPIKQKMKANGTVDAEIEYLEKTQNGKLREPVFKRIKGEYA